MMTWDAPARLRIAQAAIPTGPPPRMTARSPGLIPPPRSITALYATEVGSTRLPALVYPGIERVIWEGRTLLSTVVVTARAEAKMPVTGEVLQVRKARIVGAQGHSGHGNFPRVIECMASGMDMTPMSTKKICLEELPANILKLQTDRSECKVTYVAN